MTVPQKPAGPPPTPPPADLWVRLAILDRRCRIVMESINLQPGAQMRWSLSIWRKDDEEGAPIQMTGNSLSQLLWDGVREAEERGWDV